ncbi:MAG: hypothetical protein LC713_03520 [Actinobacteria bacterium]|nr:hypothetical protein [Actinomycetota bacterium]
MDPAIEMTDAGQAISGRMDTGYDRLRQLRELAAVRSHLQATPQPSYPRGRPGESPRPST